MTEKIEPQEEPQPKVVIEKAPESVEASGTLTVKMDEKAGVGDGKSAKKVVTPQGLGMDMYSKPITLGDGAAEGWKKVLKAAAEDGIDLTKAVVSSTRTPEQQQTLMDNEDGSTVIDPATPGTSEHVKGRALDIAVNTPEHDWMINNASKYGWKWEGVSDPFHFNFIGADSAETKIANRRGGRDRRMQKQIDREKDLKVLNSKSGRTVVPVPINKIQSVSPPVSPPKEQTLPTSTESGTNLMDTMKTLNTSLTQMAAVATQGSTYEVIEITGRAGGTIDLRLGVSSFQYFEDIMSPVVTAVMGVVTSGDTIEGQGIYSGLPIVGGEKVRIHITSPMEKQREESPGVFELTMYVNRVSDYKLENQRETFILHLVSKEGIVNMNKRILKKYKQKRIDEVIKDFLDILEADYEDENIEKTVNSINFIGNMRKPFTLAPMLAARGLSLIHI